MKIAPKELVRRDFEHLKKTVKLFTSKEIEELLFIQSIEGHAHNGHSEFHGKKFVDTTINDIVYLLGYDAFAIRSSRQALIDEIYEFVERVIAGENVTKLISKDGEPILRVPLFNEMEINAKEVLLGLYLGGLMDDYPTRKKVEEKYRINIGGGKNYLVDFEVMERMDLDGEILAHGEHEDKIEIYRKNGLIIEIEEDEKEKFLAHPSIRFQYIRHKKGNGVSDDLGMLMGGKLFHSISVALGVFLADAIDTFDKYSLKFVEQDFELSQRIKESGIIDVPEDDIFKFISLITNPTKDFPDSSQRYFLEINREKKITCLEAHLMYLRGETPPQIDIAFERVPNTELYEYVDEKLKGV